jgi:YHS domain-containing protein
MLAAVVIIMALAALAGCGSKEKTESATQKSEGPATDKTMAGTESQGVAGEQKTQPAADWSAYANPKPGVDPVCQMILEPGYVTETTIAGKKYALCSSRCVNMLLENPDQYLSAAASAEESHEGHTH